MPCTEGNPALDDQRIHRKRSEGLGKRVWNEQVLVEEGVWGHQKMEETQQW